MKELFDRLSVECSKITTQRYSTSFSWGIYFLSKEIRNPIYSIYGFVRLADEIVDSFHGYDKRALLEKFERDCYEAIEQKISLNPVLNAFQQVVNDYAIEHSLIACFLKSMAMDLDDVHYSRDKYDEYILGSAEAVGLMCLRVFAQGDDNVYEQLKPYAMRLGSAFQKVNFLRDLKADYEDLNRSYFPSVNPSVFSSADKKTIESEIEQEFEEALKGIRMLPPCCKAGVYLSYIYYKKLFNKIKRTPADKVISKRIRISNGHKLSLMFDSLIRYKTNLI